MSRASVRMSAEEVARFLRTGCTAVVAVNGPDGSTVSAVLPYTVTDEAVRLRMPLASPVTAAIESDPRICVTVEQFATYANLKGVVLHGEALAGPAGPDDDGFHLVDVPIGDDVMSFDFSRTQPAGSELSD